MCSNEAKEFTSAVKFDAIRHTHTQITCGVSAEMFITMWQKEKKKTEGGACELRKNLKILWH